MDRLETDPAFMEEIKSLNNDPAAVYAAVQGAGFDATIAEVQARVDEARTAFSTAMQDDLNTAAALGAMFELVRALNSASYLSGYSTAASATTAATATGFCHGVGTAYAENVNAMAAELAVLPTTNDQPARKPGHSPSNCRPYR